jgi:hypothetical protein
LRVPIEEKEMPLMPKFKLADLPLISVVAR